MELTSRRLRALRARLRMIRGLRRLRRSSQSIRRMMRLELMAGSQLTTDIPVPKSLTGTQLPAPMRLTRERAEILRDSLAELVIIEEKAISDLETLTSMSLARLAEIDWE